MEGKNIGIGKIIQEVHNNPKAHSTIIGRRAARIAMRRISQNRNDRPLDDTEILATAGGIITPLQVESYAKQTERIIAEHANNSKKDESIHEKVLSAVAQACMELLGDTLHRRGYVDLAHFIHNSPNAEMILSQPHRLCILEHGVIPLNSVCGYGDENVQFWTGHDTDIGKYTGAPSKHTPNMLMGLTKNGNGGMTLTVKLKGDNIVTFEDQIVVFQNGTLSIYKKPDKNSLSDFPLLGEFPCDLDTVEKVASFTTKAGWSLHRVTGKKKNQGHEAEEKKMTLCFNRDHPELSYTTDSRRYVINSNSFTIDRARGQIVILASGKIQRIACRETAGIVRLPNGEQYFEFTQRGLPMRLSFSGGRPVVSIERETGWHIYENAITETTPHTNTFRIDNETGELG